MTESAVGAPQPPLVQLLTPEGQRVEHPDYAFDPSHEQLKAFYRDLVLVRRVDTEATALQRQGELGLWASLLGQEAAQIGSGRALRAAGLWSSRPTASTASPGAATSTRSRCSACSAAPTSAGGTRTRTTSTCTRS